MRFRQFLPGDPLPHIAQRTRSQDRFGLGTAAGRYILLCLFGRPDLPGATPAMALPQARPDLFDDRFASFFGVCTEPPEALPPDRRGFRLFDDRDLKLSRALGAAPLDPLPQAPYRPHWLLADPMLRVIDTGPLTPEAAETILARLAALPPPHLHGGMPLQAPVLLLPRVFEPELCAELIARYEAHGGARSGFMREVDGRTVGLQDPGFKSRRDHVIADEAMIRRLQERIIRRVVPEIARAYNFAVTRMERYIVSCYRADEGGHFAAHRDNTTPGTAHRRFAVSINLNEDFDGGAVSFPEYGPQSFKAPVGGAVVFGCGLLHRVGRVTRGARYAFLPFVYDEAAARIRQQNLHTVEAEGALGDPG